MGDSREAACSGRAGAVWRGGRVPHGSAVTGDRSQPGQTAASMRFPASLVLVVMGVSGSGKSTVGTLLASRIEAEFADADWFHPPANIDKMHRGIPLTDDDRLPWLTAIAEWIDAKRRAGHRAVVACSALKRRYRDILIDGRTDVRLIYLEGEMDLISRRIATRHEHFMPASLLQSQFDALEPPGPEEYPIVAPIAARPAEIVDAIIAQLGKAAPT
jgi:gluconokinase